MSRIIITEKDITGSLDLGDVDIAYVPGFAGVTKNTTTGIDEIVGLDYVGKPKSISSVGEFQKYFGERPQKYGTDQAYPEYKEDGTSDGFEKNVSFYYNETTGSEPIVKANTYDTGYMYAKELLSAGLSVVYEVIPQTNTTVDSISVADVYSAFAGSAQADGTLTEYTEEFLGTEVIEDDNVAVLTYPIALKTPNYVVYSGYSSFTTTLQYVDFYVAQTVGTVTNYVKVTTENKDSLSITAGTTEAYQLNPEGVVVKKKTKNASAWTTLVQGTDYIVENVGGKGYIKLKISIINSTKLEVKYKSEVKSGTESIFKKLKDRGTYRFKYLTTGGYPVFEYKSKPSGLSVTQPIVNTLLDVVGVTDGKSEESSDITGRGDAILLLDHTNYKQRALEGDGSVIKNLQTTKSQMGSDEKLSYASMFTPWCEYYTSASYSTTIKSVRLPASFAFLACLASSIKSQPNWYAISGTTRGVIDGKIKEVLTDALLTSRIANSYQTDSLSLGELSINAITTVWPYGQTIWGVRTLLPNPPTGLKATSYLNLRGMVCDIKKKFYDTCKNLMFEQNTDILWVKFYNEMNPLLNDMKTNNGIKDYVLQKKTVFADTKEKRASDRNTIYATLSIQPVYPVEAFDIVLEISDENISETEEV